MSTYVREKVLRIPMEKLDFSFIRTAMEAKFPEEEIDDDFDFKTKLIEPGIKRTPPAHPHCRCSVLYREIEPPIQLVETQNIIMDI